MAELRLIHTYDVECKMFFTPVRRLLKLTLRHVVRSRTLSFINRDSLSENPSQKSFLLDASSRRHRAKFFPGPRSRVPFYPARLGNSEHCIASESNSLPSRGNHGKWAQIPSAQVEQA